jgi:signal transduction histidine kinase
VSVTGFEAVAVALIVAESALLVWLLRHRAIGSGARRRLNDRLRFETLLSGLSASLVHVETRGLDGALGGALRQLVVFLGVDRGNLDEYAEGTPGVRVSWAEPGIERLPSILEAGHFVWTAATLRGGGVVRFPRTAALPPEAASDRASYERLGTRSHLSIPLQAGGPMLGVLSFDSVRAERDWPDELVDRLRLLSEAFAGALERKRIEVALAERLRFQRLLSDLSARFANVSPLDFDLAVHGVLRAIVEFLGVDRAALIELSTGGDGGRVWSDDATDARCFPWLVLRLRAGDVVRAARLEELPADAAVDRRSALALGMTSLIALPLRASGAVLGGLLLATTVAERDWSEELTERLHLVGETVAKALASARAERESARLRQELAHIGRVSAMGELAASLAHELNQPLTAILNNAEVARRHLEAEAPNREELGEILADIVADDRRASEVIQRLRALVGKGTLEHVPLDINDVVAEVAQLVRNDVVLRNVPMTVELEAGLPSVCGDRIQLQQVVLNLVLNGLEAMVVPHGRGPAALVIGTSRAGEGAVRVAVEDSGSGIDVDDVDRLFQPLYTTKPEGLGMGLAIARTIVEAHGGELRASNNAGPGATVQFTLPAAPARGR